MTKRGGPCGSARSPLVKNVGQADFFNPQTRISPPSISPRLARTSSGAGRGGAGWSANLQEKKLMKVLLR